MQEYKTHKSNNKIKTKSKKKIQKFLKFPNLNCQQRKKLNYQNLKMKKLSMIKYKKLMKEKTNQKKKLKNNLKKQQQMWVLN